MRVTITNKKLVSLWTFVVPGRAGLLQAFSSMLEVEFEGVASQGSGGDWWVPHGWAGLLEEGRVAQGLSATGLLDLTTAETNQIKQHPHKKSLKYFCCTIVTVLITDRQTPRGQSPRGRWAGRPRGHHLPALQAWDRIYPPDLSWLTVWGKRLSAGQKLSRSCRCSVCLSPLKAASLALSCCPPEPFADEGHPLDGYAAPSGDKTSSEREDKDSAVR